MNQVSSLELDEIFSTMFTLSFLFRRNNLSFDSIDSYYLFKFDRSRFCKTLKTIILSILARIKKENKIDIISIRFVDITIC